MQPFQHVAVGPSVRQLSEVIRDGGKAEPARPALACALAGEEPQDARGLREPTAAGREREDHARAGRGPRVAQPGSGQRQAGDVPRGVPGAEVPADEHGTVFGVPAAERQHVAPAAAPIS